MPPDITETSINWTEITRDIFSAAAFIQPKTDYFITSRDETIWEGGSINGNPDGDPDAEIVLKNNQGSLQIYVFELCKKAKGYFLYITSLNERFMAMTQYINLGSLSFILLSVALYCFIKIRQHHKMIEKTLFFKVVLVQSGRRCG